MITKKKPQVHLKKTGTSFPQRKSKTQKPRNQPKKVICLPYLLLHLYQTVIVILEWDEREEIPDPDATKPEDWDKPEHIADPDATKPDDWDDDMDGEWEAPMVDNPDFKGNNFGFYFFGDNFDCRLK